MARRTRGTPRIPQVTQPAQAGFFAPEFFGPPADYYHAHPLRGAGATTITRAPVYVYVNVYVNVWRVCVRVNFAKLASCTYVYVDV